MDEDDWLASIDLESLERGIQQQQRPGKSVPVVATADQQVQARCNDQQYQIVQMHATCKAGNAQQPAQHKSEHKSSLHAMTAADLLKGTLSNHPTRQAPDMTHHQGAMPLRQLQQWPGQHQKHPQTARHACSFDPPSNSLGANGVAYHQLSNNQQHTAKLSQTFVGHKLGPSASQQHWPDDFGTSLPQPHQQQQLHAQHVAGISDQQRHQTHWQQQNWQQQQWTNHNQVHEPQHGWQQQQQPTRGPVYFEQQQSHQHQQLHQQQSHQHPPAYPYQSNHAHEAQTAHQAADDIVPRCPYRVCPGVFNFCGAELCYRKRKDGTTGFWSCSTWPGCDFKYFPAQQVPRPELGCEIVDEETFRLAPQPAAEVAVAKAGGIRAVLAAAGVTLDHLEVKQPAVIPELDLSTADMKAAADKHIGQQQQQEQHQRRKPAAATASVDPAEPTVAQQATKRNAAGAAAAESTAAAVPDFSWSPEDSMLLRLVDYELVVALLNTAKPPLLGKGGAIPPQTLEAFRSPDEGLATTEEVEMRYNCMPLSLQQALLPFQQAGVKFGLGRHGRVLIADEMGVGKTVQALALAACYQDEWPLLVVVPASLRLVWAEEIERWLPHVRPGEVTVIEGREDRLCDLPDANARRLEKLPGITITSYEMLKRLSCAACQKLPTGPAGSGGGRGRGGGRGSGKARQCCTGPDHCMAALPWGVVIIDESHNLRTTNSRQADSPHTEAAVAAGSSAKHVILLSGTPSLSRPYDLYRQVDLLVPGLLGLTKEEFAHRYCDRRLVPVITSRGENRLRWNNAGGARLVELHGLLVRRVMIRRLKKDVMAQLPPKRRQVVRLPYPSSNRWPKEQEPGAATAKQEQQQQQQQQQSNPQEPAEGANGAAGTNAGKDDASGSEEAAAAGVMSAAHRTALAKLPDAIDWLLAALGESSGSTASSGAPAATAAARSSRAQAPSGPLKPAWKKDTGNSSGSSACGSSAAATAVKHEDVDVVDDEEDGSGGSSSSAAAGGSSGPKFLVFAHHRDVMDKLAAALSGFISSSRSADPDEVEDPPTGSSSSRQPRGVGYVRVDGSHDSTERLTAVQRFRSDPTIRVALLSITAAAVGLDFSSASMVVFVELPTEVSLVRQAEDRAHRKGQCKAVNVYFLCAQGTVDDKRWQALNISLSHVSQVHDGQAETLPEPLARPADADTEADTAEEQQQQQVGGVEKQQQRDQDVVSYEQQQQPQVQEQVAAAEQEPAAEAASNEEHALCTPMKSTAAAAAHGGGGGGEADTSAAKLVDLTAESPAAPNSSSRKRKRQPLDLSPAATRSPAAAAAALAAAARTPVPSCRKQAQQRTPSAVNKSVITAAEAAGDGSSAVPVVVPDVWFEVSGHTNRLHYHLHPDGSKPLGMNLPLHWLMMPEEQGSLRQMAAAWDNAQQQLKVKQEELQQRQVLSQQQQQQKQQESRASQQPQQQPQAQCTQLGFLGQQSQQQAAVDQDAIQQQQCFLSPTVQQKVLHSLQGVQLQSQQQQQQQQPNLAAAPLSAAAGGGGSSRGTGRGAARPALSSIVLLPFTSPTATPTAAASKTPDGHMAATSQQQQQQASGSNDSRSPTVVSSSPALSERIRRLLHQQNMQQPSQQQGDHVLGAQADVQPAAVISEQYTGVSLPVVADVIAETPDSQQQQPGHGNVDSAAQLLLLDSQDDDRQQQQQQQQDGSIVVHSSGQQQQQQGSQTQPDHVLHQLQEQQETDAATAAAVQSLPDCRHAAGFFGPSGLTCLTLTLTRFQLLELLRLGAAFASDWSELRSVTRNRLAGKVVPPDLTAAVEAVSAAAVGSGAFGVGVVRYMKDIQEGDPNLPQGAWLETVTVHYPQGRQPVVKYRQAFTGPTTRHCINCFKAVEGAVLPADAVLMGGLDLFCSAECERAYYIKNSSSGIRRALFKLERGVCVVCGVDGHNLVKQLQQIGKDEPNWAATRRCIVAQHAPRFLERGYATYLDKLINQATEGNAWHADHIVPVYAGGGGCDLDNLRTLCVPCHAGVTRQQARERAEERQRRKLGTRDIRHWFGGTAAAAQGDNQGSASKKAMKPNHVMKRKRRAAVEAVFVDDALSPEINTAVNRKTARKVPAAAALGGESLNADVVTDEGDDELQRALRESLLQQQQQQQQQHHSVDVISIISSPSCDTQPPAAAAAVTVAGGGGGGGGGEQQQPFSAMVSTPTSAVRSSQELRRTEQKTAASVVPSPPADPRAAAAAAKGAAAVAGSKEGARGVLSVLDQFKYTGRSSQQDDAQQLSHQKRQAERRGELAIADSSDNDSAEAVAACGADAAAAGQAVHRHSCSSRRAARAAAAAINKQLGGLGCGSSDDEEERGSPLLEGSLCGQQQQEHAGAKSVTGVLYVEQGSFATAAGACRSKRVVKATAAGSSKQPQQRKRARGGKRDRSVLDST